MRAVDLRALSTNDEDDRSQLDVVCVPSMRVYMTDSSARDQPVNPFILLADRLHSRPDWRRLFIRLTGSIRVKLQVKTMTNTLESRT